MHRGKALERTNDPGWYDYPTLPIALSGLMLELASLPSSERKRAADLEATAYGASYDEVRPTRGLVGTRLLTALLAMATVLLVMVTTARLTRRRVALVAGAVTAVTPALVSRSVFDLVDTLATFFVVATFVGGLAAAQAGRRSRRFGWVLRELNLTRGNNAAIHVLVPKSAAG